MFSVETRHESFAERLLRIAFLDKSVLQTYPLLKQFPIAMSSWDQTKAFDCYKFQFLYKVMGKMNFCESF